MAGWTEKNEVSRSTIDETSSLERYSPRDLTNDKDFAKQLREIDSNQTLTTLDKHRYRRQLMRAVFHAKQKEISHHLDSYENYLLARKDVEAKSITLEAQKAIMYLEAQQLQMMKEIGLDHSEEISSTLIRSGNMLTNKLREVEESDMLPEIKHMTLKSVRRVWEKTNDRVLASVDTYMDELYEKERNRGHA
ncbi:MAG: hypothetical protein EA428_08295 [Spirochaetaceae bacterium]|nr:MAG: hypothetical protein EA428_08295 [Spirochaetaceae bacterium]